MSITVNNFIQKCDVYATSILDQCDPTYQVKSVQYIKEDLSCRVCLQPQLPGGGHCGGLFKKIIRFLLLSSTAVPTSLDVYSLMTSLILVNGLFITVYEYTFEFPGGQERGSEWQAGKKFHSYLNIFYFFRPGFTWISLYVFTS